MFLVMGEAGIVDDVHGRREIVRRISHDCFNVQFVGRVDHGWLLVLGHPFTTDLDYLGEAPERAAFMISSYKARIWRAASATSSSLIASMTISGSSCIPCVRVSRNCRNLARCDIGSSASCRSFR